MRNALAAICALALLGAAAYPAEAQSRAREKYWITWFAYEVVEFPTNTPRSYYERWKRSKESPRTKRKHRSGSSGGESKGGYHRD